MTLRAIVCYTGGVGSELVRQLLRNPAFELVGVLVHSQDKDGQDVGDIAGIGRGCGPRATWPRSPGSRPTSCPGMG